MRKPHVTLRMAAVLLASAALALVSPAGVAPAQSTVEAGLYQVHTVRGHRSSRLVAIDPETGRERRATDLDHTVNAIGYDPAQGLFVGVATRREGHPIGDGGHVVTITPSGETRDLGPVRALGPPISRAYAGTAVDGRLHLLLDGDLVTVDVRPRSPTFLRVVRRLDLPRLPSFGDWDARPGDGALYAVTTQGREPSRLVRVDPVTGTLTETPVRGLPGHGFYGAVAFDGTGTHLYATDNNHGSTLYRIGLDGTATTLARGPILLGSDAAWRREPGPPAPAPTTGPAPAPTPPRTPAAAARPPVPPRRVPSPPAAPTTTPPVTTPPPPTPVAAVRAARERTAVVEPPEDDRTTTVRFGIVLLVLGLGGAAVAKPVAKARVR